ncbi:MAG: tyrosine-type recombinase/integrase [Rhodospirillales bacterium]|nr:tyrosine-type recombinase/integrase [Rhodospirillales bacterium]
MPTVDLTAKLARDSRPGEKETILFDRALPGFGLRIHPSGRKVWIVQARIDGRTRRLGLARHGEIALAEARRRAREMLARIRAGDDPAEEARKARAAPTVKDFADEYLRCCGPGLKPSGRRTVRIYLKARILPAFGAMRLDMLGPEDVAAWFDAASRDWPGAANRALEILRAMMFRAEEWGWRAPGTNPCLGIRMNPKKPVARFLDTGEFERLGRALDARAADWPETVAAIRLLALTGCRRGEVLTLRWRNIGRDTIQLDDAKAGPRTVPLGSPARAILDALPGERRPDAFVFPEHARSAWWQDQVRVRWHAICADAGIGRARLHDLRHAVASHAVMSGENLPLVGKLLGHRRQATTAGYAHLADDHLVAAAEHVGSIIAEAMALDPGASDP